MHLAGRAPGWRSVLRRHRQRGRHGLHGLQSPRLFQVVIAKRKPEHAKQGSPGEQRQCDFGFLQGGSFCLGGLRVCALWGLAVRISRERTSNRRQRTETRESPLFVVRDPGFDQGFRGSITVIATDLSRRRGRAQFFLHDRQFANRADANEALQHLALVLAGREPGGRFPVIGICPLLPVSLVQSTRVAGRQPVDRASDSSGNHCV